MTDASSSGALIDTHEIVTAPNVHCLTARERDELESLIRQHSLARIARYFGLSRTATSSLLAGRARQGTLVLYRERRESLPLP